MRHKFRTKFLHDNHIAIELPQQRGVRVKFSDDKHPRYAVCIHESELLSLARACIAALQEIAEGETMEEDFEL